MRQQNNSVDTSPMMPGNNGKYASAMLATMPAQ
jgi:hypothetical protein